MSVKPVHIPDFTACIRVEKDNLIRFQLFPSLRIHQMFGFVTEFLPIILKARRSIDPGQAAVQ